MLKETASLRSCRSESSAKAAAAAMASASATAMEILKLDIYTL